jgi:hypothetical protein
MIFFLTTAVKTSNPTLQILSQISFPVIWISWQFRKSNNRIDNTKRDKKLLALASYRVCSTWWMVKHTTQFLASKNCKFPDHSKDILKSFYVVLPILVQSDLVIYTVNALSSVHTHQQNHYLSRTELTFTKYLIPLSWSVM